MFAEKVKNQNSNKITFPKVAIIGEVESTLKSYFSENDHNIEYLELDLIRINLNYFQYNPKCIL